MLHIVERAGSDLDDVEGPRSGRHAIAIKRGHPTLDMEWHTPSGILRRRCGGAEHLGLARAHELFGELRQRLDQDAAPAALLQVKGLRALARMVGADLDEKAGRGPEEIPHQLLLKLV